MPGAEPIVVTGVATVRIDSQWPRSQVESLHNGDYLRGNAAAPLTRIIGGSATDNLTGIKQVEVSVDRGNSWQPAMGRKVWAFPLTASDGSVTLATRATDGAGNVEDPPTEIEVFVDGRSPEFDFSLQPAGVVVPGRNADGRWTAPLGGAIHDPDLATGQPGSGVSAKSLLVRLHGAGALAEMTGEWESAVLVGGQWSLVYRFPTEAGDPTGAWIAELIATDNVGNLRQEMAPEPFYVDSAAPVAELDREIAELGMLSGSMQLTGVITDTLAGIDQLDVAFAPLEQVAPMSGALLWLPFDEPAGRPYWEDRSGQGNDARCLPATQTCPSAGHDGREGGGLYFEKAEGYYLDAVVVGDAGDFNFDKGASFSIQAWAKSEDWVYGGLVQKPNAYALGLGEDSYAALGAQKLGGRLVGVGARTRDHERRVVPHCWHLRQPIRRGGRHHAAVRERPTSRRGHGSQRRVLRFQRAAVARGFPQFLCGLDARRGRRLEPRALRG